MGAMGKFISVTNCYFLPLELGAWEREPEYAFLSRELGSSAPELSLVIQRNYILIR
jgi:hypothetical protein